MSGINKVILIGNIGRDPEVGALPNGDAVCNLALATSESWKDKNTGEKKERTEWHRIVLFRRTADVAREYVKKGDKLYVEGKLQTRKWTDKDGSDRYTTEVVGHNIQMLTPKQARQEANQYKSQAEPNYGNVQQPNPPSGSTEAPFDDDIPF